eukprot:3678420-Rhodomonas_salina.3
MAHDRLLETADSARQLTAVSFGPNHCRLRHCDRRRWNIIATTLHRCAFCHQTAPVASTS